MKPPAPQVSALFPVQGELQLVAEVLVPPFENPLPQSKDQLREWLILIRKMTGKAFTHSILGRIPLQQKRMHQRRKTRHMIQRSCLLY
jgi:hypothetical protein